MDENTKELKAELAEKGLAPKLAYEGSARKPVLTINLGRSYKVEVTYNNKDWLCHVTDDKQRALNSFAIFKRDKATKEVHIWNGNTDYSNCTEKLP